MERTIYPGYPKRVVVQRRGPGQLQREEELVSTFVKRCLGVEVVEVHEKKLARNFFPLNSTDLVVGGVQFMKHAARILGKELSEHEPYPLCLRDYLYRDVERVRSLREAKHMLDDGKRFFIKPEGWKTFTGFVCDNSMDPRFNGSTNQQPVWISTLVEFVSEFRAYVVRGNVRSIASYAGDETIRPNIEVILNAVKEFTDNGAPAGYAIDFGVLADGETALVEVNDGFSVGAYGHFLSEHYFDMLAARWQELLGVTWGQ